MMITRVAQVPVGVPGIVGMPGRVPDAEPLQVQAAQVFAGEQTAG